MRALRPSVVDAALAVVLAALGVADAGAQSFRLPREPRDSTEPHFVETLAGAAHAAGLAPLHTAALPAGRRELRVWVGFGLGMPDALYRIHQAAGGAASGELVLWWEHRREWSAADNPESAHAYVTRAFGCGPIRRRVGVDACRPAALRPAADWGRLLARLDSLGARTLPDQSALPGGAFHALDGISVVVEDRDGARYRTYYYSNPHADARPDAQRAAAIMDGVRTVWDAALRDTAPSAAARR